MADPSKRELVQAAAGGNLESFGQLCRECYPALVAIAYSVVGDHQLAEDAAQESFARAIVQLRSLRDRSKFGPWLAAICRNVAKDMLRVNMRGPGMDYASPAVGASDHGRESETPDVVRHAVSQLSPAAREIVSLRYYDGLTHDEIAVVLGVSAPTISRRLVRAKQDLMRILRRNGYAEDCI